MSYHAVAYDGVNGRKRGVSDKYFGPLIKTVMTRCIHCTRCVRFVDEILGHPVIGSLGRSTHTDISLYSYDMAISTATAHFMQSYLRTSAFLLH